MFLDNLDSEAIIHDLFYNNEYNNITALLGRVDKLYKDAVPTQEEITGDIIDKEFIDEIKAVMERGEVCLYFGNTMRELKCVIMDDCERQHSVFVEYLAPKRLRISSTTLPDSPYMDVEYSRLQDIIVTFMDDIDSLTNYFVVLERIDRFCTVVEPVTPTFKEEFRKIVLDERVWLHFEVTPKGGQCNMHIIGQRGDWNERLEVGLSTWDQDKDILDNVMRMFDLVNFPNAEENPYLANITFNETQPVNPDLPAALSAPIAEDIVCGICFIGVSDGNGPLPLCPNSRCCGYFHTGCLYEWLVVSTAGGRPQPLGVASGACPACLEPVSVAKGN